MQKEMRKIIETNSDEVPRSTFVDDEIYVLDQLQVCKFQTFLINQIFPYFINTLTKDISTLVNQLMGISFSKDVLSKIVDKDYNWFRREIYPHICFALLSRFILNHISMQCNEVNTFKRTFTEQIHEHILILYF